MPTAVFDTADVIASMCDNVAKCMADNAALLRQLHGRAQSGGFPGLASEGALQQAPLAKNKAGYLGVTHRPDRSKPYERQVRRGGKDVRLSSLATAEEAALCVARSPEGQAVAAERAAAAVPLTSEEARQQAQAEGCCRPWLSCYLYRL